MHFGMFLLERELVGFNSFSIQLFFCLLSMNPAEMISKQMPGGERVGDFLPAEDHKKKKRNQYSTSILDKQTILQPSGEGSVDISLVLLILILLYFILILVIQGTGIQSRYLI